MRRATGSLGMRLLLLTLVLLVAGFVLLARYAFSTSSLGQPLTISALYRLADNNQIVSATLLDEDAQVVGTMATKSCLAPAAATPGSASPVTGANGGFVPIPMLQPNCPGPIAAFHLAYPRSDVATQELINRIAADGARLEVDQQTGKAVAKLLLTFVFPLLVLANLFGLVFLSRSGDSTIADIAGFGRIGRQRERDRASTGVTFADVAGAQEAVTELREVTDYLGDPKKFERFGASAPKGILLFGPPGCGKTLLARAVAGEAGVPFFSISGAEFIESLVGVGAARVRSLFADVRKAAPAIVFIDEIDAVGRRRTGEGMSGGEREQTVNQLLVEMDGFAVSQGIVVMAATNRPDILDPALLRPGRFDRHVTLTAPDLAGRQEILELHARGKPLAPDVDFTSLARGTSGFTGADLANVINEAALLALREGEGTRIQMSHLGEAGARVLHGPRRRGRLMTAEERKRLAYHESGHALVASALGQAAQVHRVSIVARGRGLGHSMIAEEEERVLLTQSEMSAQLTVAMGGMTAEQMYFGEPSTTAEDDIDRATQLARSMVGRYGMSAELGPLRVLSKEDGYLGGDGASIESVSGQTLQGFDSEVRRLLMTATHQAAEVLAAHRPPLERMAARLEEVETLEGPTLSGFLDAVRPEMGVATTGQAPPQGAPTGTPARPRS